MDGICLREARGDVDKNMLDLFPMDQRLNLFTLLVALYVVFMGNIIKLKE